MIDASPRESTFARIRSGLFSAGCLCVALGCQDSKEVVAPAPAQLAVVSFDGNSGITPSIIAPSPGVDINTNGVCMDVATPGFAAPLRTIYVDARTGNDKDTGKTQKNAWKTIAKANTEARAGDLFLLAGTFKGQYIRPDSSGTATRKIVFRALPGANAVLNGGDFDTAIWLDGRQHIVVDGLEVENAAYAILVRGGASNIWLRNLNVHDVATAGLTILQSSDNRFENSTIKVCGEASNNTGDCIWIADGANRNIIARNTIKRAGHGTIFIGGDRGDLAVSQSNVVVSNDLANRWAANVGLTAAARGTLIECNKIRASSQLGVNYARSGIQVTASSNIIRYNEIYNNTADGIQIQGYNFQGMTQNSTGNQVYNNTFWGNGGAAVQLLQKDVSQVSNNVIQNNIFWGNNASPKTNADSRYYNGAFQDIWIDLYNANAVWPAGSLNGNVIKNNIIARGTGDVGKGWLIIVRKASDGDNSYYTMTEAQKAFSTVSGNMQKDPLFQGANDVTLRNNSPAIDAGAALPGVAFRGKAPDMGAHERN